MSAGRDKVEWSDIADTGRPTRSGADCSVTGALEHAVVAATVSLGEGLHHTVDLLGLAGQPEAPQELPESLDQVEVRELVQVQEGVKNCDVEIIPEEEEQKGRIIYTYKCCQVIKNLIRLFTFIFNYSNYHFNQLSLFYRRNY